MQTQTRSVTLDHRPGFMFKQQHKNYRTYNKTKKNNYQIKNNNTCIMEKRHNTNTTDRRQNKLN